jgi:hypothetical protein
MVSDIGEAMDDNVMKNIDEPKIEDIMNFLGF